MTVFTMIGLDIYYCLFPAIIFFSADRFTDLHRSYFTAMGTILLVRTHILIDQLIVNNLTRSYKKDREIFYILDFRSMIFYPGRKSKQEKNLLKV